MADHHKHLLGHEEVGTDESKLLDAEHHHDGPPPEYQCHRRVLFSCIVLSVAAIIIAVAAVLRTTSSSPSSPVPAPTIEMPSCTHPIYCTGPLLHAVQTGGVFSDCKTFVDMPLLFSVEQTLKDFADSSAKQGFNITAFVRDHFDPPGSEVVTASPIDYVTNPPAFDSIVDQKLKSFAQDVNAIWPQLFRRHNVSKYCGQMCVSSILVNNTFVVPGGRFREFYYWDSYWIVRGLLVSGMVNSTRDILLNFLSIVDEYGFMPNGGRVYYGDRSQPPLLTQMVKKYVDATADIDLLLYALPILDREHAFWMRTHSVDDYNASHVLSRYNVDTSAPRPESYREDLATQQQSRRGDNDIFSNLAAGAETGWDYSSRFLENAINLTTIDSTDIAPVDLNAIMLMNEETMRFWYQGGPGYEVLRNASKRLEYDLYCSLRSEAMMFHLRDPTAAFGAGFHDKNMNRGELLKRSWYPSTALPLLTTQVLDRLDLTTIKMIADGIVGGTGGVPTSQLTTGQQWDMPNAWAPLQMFMIEVLQVVSQTVERAEKARYEAKALSLAQAWIDTTYCGFKNYKMMFEKYDVHAPGQPGGGGEYVVQAGFGWTNGVVLELLVKYGASLKLTKLC